MKSKKRCCHHCSLAAHPSTHVKPHARNRLAYLASRHWHPQRRRRGRTRPENTCCSYHARIRTARNTPHTCPTIAPRLPHHRELHHTGAPAHPHTHPHTPACLLTPGQAEPHQGHSFMSKMRGGKGGSKDWEGERVRRGWSVAETSEVGGRRRRRSKRRTCPRLRCGSRPRQSPRAAERWFSSITFRAARTGSSCSVAGSCHVGGEEEERRRGGEPGAGVAGLV